MRHDSVPHWPGDPFGLAGAPAPLGRSGLRTQRYGRSDRGRSLRGGPRPAPQPSYPLWSGSASLRRQLQPSCPQAVTVPHNAPLRPSGTSVADAGGSGRYAGPTSGPPPAAPAVANSSWRERLKKNQTPTLGRPAAARTPAISYRAGALVRVLVQPTTPVRTRVPSTHPGPLGKYGGQKAGYVGYLPCDIALDLIE
jgi:hypothetical protein